MHLLPSVGFSRVVCLRKGLHVTNDTRAISHEVHALLLSAHPHAGDVDLAKAAELAVTNLGGDDNVQKSVFLAVQKARQAIDNGVGAAEGQQLLLDALRCAEHWTRTTSE
jgi:hypothetical protein